MADGKRQASGVYNIPAGGIASLFPDPIVKSGTPTTSTKGEIGQTYIDPGVAAYTCIARDSSGYTWVTSPASGAGTFTAVTINPGDLTLTAGDIIVTAGDITATAGTTTVGTLVAAATTVTTFSASSNASVTGTFTTTGNTALVSTGTGTIALGSATAGAITVQNNAAIDVDSSAAISINSTGGALNVGNDADNQAVNVGTAGTRTITIGSATATNVIAGASSINASVNANTLINTGTSTGTVTIGNVANAGAILITGSSTITAASAGDLVLGSTAADVEIANDAVAQNVNVGTGAAAKAVTVGSANTTSATSILAGTGNLAVTGLGAVPISGAGDVTIGSTGGNIEIAKDAVAQNVEVGTGAAAKAVTVGSTNTTSGTTINAGSNGLSLVAGGLINAEAATASAAAATVAVNAQLFSATFTGITTGAGVSAQLTITNSTVLGTSGVCLSMVRVQSGSDVLLTIDGIETVAGSIIIDYTNNGAAANDTDIIVSGWVLN